MSQLRILVPADITKRPLDIAGGSAIVARPMENDSGHILYYEGNLNRAGNLHDYDTRLIVAVGRLQDNYPTVAKQWVSDEVLEATFRTVGYFIGDVRSRAARRTDITDTLALQEWVSCYSQSGGQACK